MKQNTRIKLLEAALEGFPRMDVPSTETIYVARACFSMPVSSRYPQKQKKPTDLMEGWEGEITPSLIAIEAVCW